jgi:hypothetical protein
MLHLCLAFLMADLETCMVEFLRVNFVLSALYYSDKNIQILPELKTERKRELHLLLGNESSGLEDAAIAYCDAAGSLAIFAAASLHLGHNTHTFHHLAENNVFVVQMRGWDCRDKKLEKAQELNRCTKEAHAQKSGRRHSHLAAVGVGARIGHRKQSWNTVFVFEVLVGKLCAVDALAASPVVIGEVASLQHEARNDAVEAGALVSTQRVHKLTLTASGGVAPEALLASAKRLEICVRAA